MVADVKIQQASLLPALQNHKDKEVAYAIDENAYYIYSEENGAWEPAPHSELTVYDMNKQVVNQMPFLSDEEIEKAKEIIKDWKKDKGSMLLLFGKEISFISIFQKQILAKDNLEDAIINLLADRFDGIRNVIAEDDDTIGFWVDYDSHPTYMKLMEWEGNIYNG